MQSQFKIYQEYKCIDCNDNINFNTFLYGQQRCKSCGQLNRRKNNLLIKKDDLFMQYIILQQSTWQIVKIFKCSQPTVCKYLKKYNISIRTSQEGTKLRVQSLDTRSKMSLGKGGTGIPYEFALYDRQIFNKKLKQEIRTRDNFICQCCGMTEKQHLKKFHQVLHVHHIDYNKQNCNKSNLITTCHTCNVIANGNRDYWFAFYTYLINKEILYGRS